MEENPREAYRGDTQSRESKKNNVGEITTGVASSQIQKVLAIRLCQFGTRILKVTQQMSEVRDVVQEAVIKTMSSVHGDSPGKNSGVDCRVPL